MEEIVMFILTSMQGRSQEFILGWAGISSK